MNEFYSSLFLLISEIGVILFLILGAILFVSRRRCVKDKALAMVLVQKIKNAEPEKREKLLSLLKDVYGYDDEEAEARMEALIDCEKTLYGNLLKIFLKKEREKISEFDNHLNKLIESYQGFSHSEGGSESQDEAPKSSKLILVREENTSLREANAKLKKDLDAAMQTMESMMSEYTSMYEGGKKDGEQRMKNEMFKLQQTLARKAEDDEVEDIEINVEEIDLDESEESKK